MSVIKKRKFYRTLLSTFLLISIIPSIIIALFTSLLVENTLQKKLVAESKRTVSETMLAIDTVIDSYANIVQQLSENAQIVQFISQNTATDNAKMYELLYATRNQLDSTSDIHLVSLASEKVLSLKDTPSVYDIQKNKNWGCFRSANDSRVAVMHPQEFRNLNHIQMIGMVIQAIRKDDAVLGYVAIDIPFEAIKKTLNGKNELLLINFTLMTGYNYYLLNNLDLKANSQFISWKNDSLLNTTKEYVIEKSSHGRLLITTAVSKKHNLVLFGGLNIDLILGNLSIVPPLLVISAILALAVCIVVSIVFSVHINRPLKTMVQAMRSVEEGNFDEPITIVKLDEFGYIAQQFNRMCIKVKELFVKNQEKQEALRIAEIKNLQAQINPHFLYNTLDSIKWLAKMHNEAEIYTMSASLSRLMRKSIALSNKFITLQETLADLDSYISIQKIRFPDKFSVCFDLEESLMDFKIPPLLLQPIVENAMIHGLEKKAGKGSLIIKGVRNHNKVVLQIIDDGVGCDSAHVMSQIANSTVAAQNADHIGLINVNNRIRLHYGSDFGLTIESMPNINTTVTIVLPYEEDLS